MAALARAATTATSVIPTFKPIARKAAPKIVGDNSPSALPPVPHAPPACYPRREHRHVDAHTGQWLCVGCHHWNAEGHLWRCIRCSNARPKATFTEYHLDVVKHR